MGSSNSERNRDSLSIPRGYLIALDYKKVDLSPSTMKVYVLDFPLGQDDSKAIMDATFFIFQHAAACSIFTTL